MNHHYHQEKKYQHSVAGKRKQTPKAQTISHDEADDRKKDKKLVFLSKSVLKKVRERPMVTGT
jgi:hypothetical protein